MILIITHWLLVIYLNLVIGFSIAWLFNNKNPNINIGLPLVILLGWALNTLFFAIWALFGPINLLALSCLVALSALLIYINHQDLKCYLSAELKHFRSFHLFAIIFAVLLMAIGVLKTLGPTEIYDEAHAYLPFFKMLSEWGLTKGFGNLHINATYNSFWHYSSVGFGGFLQPAFTRLFNLNGLLMLVFAIAAGSALNRVIKNKNCFADYLLIIAPFLVFRNQLSSPATDVVVAIIGWILFSELLRKNNTNYKQVLFPSAIIIISWLFTIKVTTSWLLILIPVLLYYLKKTGEKPGKIATAALISACFAAVWFLGNYMLTGYVYFVKPAIDLFDPIWKVPLEFTYPGYDTKFLPLKEISWAAITQWFSYYTAFEKLLIISVPLAFGILIYAISRKKKQQNNYGVLPALTITLFLGIVLWFKTNTELRYGILQISTSALLGIALIIWYAREHLHLQKLTAYGLIGFALISSGYNFYKTQKEYVFFTRHLLHPSPYPKVEFESEVQNGITFHKPTRYTSPPSDRYVFYWNSAKDLEHTPMWETPIPWSSSLKKQPHIHMLGTEYKDGFYNNLNN